MQDGLMVINKLLKKGKIMKNVFESFQLKGKLFYPIVVLNWIFSIKNCVSFSRECMKIFQMMDNQQFYFNFSDLELTEVK